MNNQREIYEALLAGETLMNEDTGFKVLLEDGELRATEKPNIFQDVPNFFPVRKWHIYKEPKWYENISGDILCRTPRGRVVRIVKESEGTLYDDSKENTYDCDYLTPLTEQEIQIFMDNAPEK